MNHAYTLVIGAIILLVYFSMKISSLILNWLKENYPKTTFIKEVKLVPETQGTSETYNIEGALKNIRKSKIRATVSAVISIYVLFFSFISVILYGVYFILINNIRFHTHLPYFLSEHSSSWPIIFFFSVGYYLVSICYINFYFLQIKQDINEFIN